jgi:hypothetical protein
MIPGQELKPPLDNALLEHYGIKGMKWGVRRDRSGPAPLPGARSSMKVGNKVGQKIYNYKNAPDRSGVSRKQARRTVKNQNRSLQRELEDFNALPPRKRDQAILDARRKLTASNRSYEDVKRSLKDQKSNSTIGKNAARAALNKAKNARSSTALKASEMTEREKFVKSLQDIGRQILQDYNRPGAGATWTTSSRSRPRASAPPPRQQPFRTTSTRVG